MTLLMLGGSSILQGCAGCVRTWIREAGVAVPLTALVVAVIEELLFRGALQGAVRKTTVDGFALVAVAMLFAAVHFLKPPGQGIAAADIHWWSGLALLPDTLWHIPAAGAAAGGV